MGEALYLAARIMMWLCFLALPFSPFLLMIEDPVLRFWLFGSSIGVELFLLFTGCSLKIFNHWREQKIEKIVEREGFTRSPSLRPTVQLESSLEHGQQRNNGNKPLSAESSPLTNSADATAECNTKTSTIRFEKDST